MYVCVYRCGYILHGFTRWLDGLVRWMHNKSSSSDYDKAPLASPYWRLRCPLADHGFAPWWDSWWVVKVNGLNGGLMVNDGGYLGARCLLSYRNSTALVYSRLHRGWIFLQCHAITNLSEQPELKFTTR